MLTAQKAAREWLLAWNKGEDHASAAVKAAEVIRALVAESPPPEQEKETVESIEFEIQNLGFQIAELQQRRNRLRRSQGQ